MWFAKQYVNTSEFLALRMTDTQTNTLTEFQLNLCASVTRVIPRTHTHTCGNAAPNVSAWFAAAVACGGSLRVCCCSFVKVAGKSGAYILVSLTSIPRIGFRAEIGRVYRLPIQCNAPADRFLMQVCVQSRQESQCVSVGRCDRVK